MISHLKSPESCIAFNVQSLHIKTMIKSMKAMNYTMLFHWLFFVSQKCSKKCVHTYTCARGHVGIWNIRNQRRPHCFPVYIYDCKFNTGKKKKRTNDDILCNKMNTSDSCKTWSSCLWWKGNQSNKFGY